MNKGIIAGVTAVVGVTAAVAGIFFYKKHKKKKKYAETTCRNSKKAKAKTKVEEPEEAEDFEEEKDFSEKVEETFVNVCEFVVEHEKEIEAVSMILGVVTGIISFRNAIKEGKAMDDMNAKLDLLLRESSPPDGIFHERITIRRFRPNA